jgi:hypothetical protein
MLRARRRRQIFQTSAHEIATLNSIAGVFTMNFRSLPIQILGSLVLGATIVTRIFVPAVSDFWLAVGTAIALFLAVLIQAQRPIEGEPASDIS